MNKKLPVIWSPAAEQTYTDIILYLIPEWSLNSAKKFDKKTDKLINTKLIFFYSCYLAFAARVTNARERKGKGHPEDIPNNLSAAAYGRHILH